MCPAPQVCPGHGAGHTAVFSIMCVLAPRLNLGSCQHCGHSLLEVLRLQSSGWKDRPGPQSRANPGDSCRSPGSGTPEDRAGGGGCKPVGRCIHAHECLCTCVTCGPQGSRESVTSQALAPSPRGSTGSWGLAAVCWGGWSLVSAGFFINLLCEQTLSSCCEAGHLLLFPACPPGGGPHVKYLRFCCVRF